MADINAEWLDLAWWNERCGDRLDGRSVVEVVPDMPKAITQLNSAIVPFAVRLADGDGEVCWERVVLKHVVLAPEGLASPTARGSAAKNSSASNRATSYKVEATFYRDWAEPVKQAGAVLPSALCCECSDAEQLLVLEDLTHEGALWHEETGRSQEQLLTLDEQQTELALDWAARLHARFWGRSCGAETEELWPAGAYWTLDKRQQELAIMEAEWSKTVANFQDEFPDVFGAPGVQQLAARLRAAATPLANALDVSGPWHQARWSTVVHGDFKTANMFFSHTASPGEQRISVCDFQWTGHGLGVLDVLYVLFTSTDPALVAAKEGDFLDYYYDRLQAHLVREVAAGHVEQAAAASYTRKIFLQYYEVAYLDYVRFLIGRMWGAVSPESCKGLATALNHGTHKRFAGHLVHMVQKADHLLGQLEADGWPGTTPSLHLSADGAPLLLRILDTAATLACEAGDVIRSMLEDAGGRMAASQDKGDFGFGEADPQTQADLAAEKCIINGLARAFPGLTVVGEEGLATSEGGEKGAAESVGGGSLQFIPNLDTLAQTDLLDSSVTLEDVCVWVDPLDGTQEFVDGNLERVTVLIGITVKGSPVAGAILQPFVDSADGSGKGRLLWGGRGLGVWDGGARGVAHAVRVPAAARTGPPVVATSRSHPSPAVAEAAAALQPSQTLQLGGAGSKVLMIIEGQLSHWVYPRKGTKRWDTAAPEALLRAVGGFCVDQHGQPYDYAADCEPRNDEGVIAGGGMLAWEQCVAAFGWDTTLPS